MDTHPTKIARGDSSAQRESLVGDRIMLTALCVAGAASLAIGRRYGDLSLAAMGTALIIALGVIGPLCASGRFASRMVLGLSLSAMVALHIHLGRGTVEFHFGVFVVLALLLVYRDWRPILASASFFVVHHVLFDRLQASGYAIYCTPEPDFLKMILHIGYVVVQTGLEIHVAIWMSQLAAAGGELEALVHEVDQGDTLSLDVGSVATVTHKGRQLKEMVARINQAMLKVRSSVGEISAASNGIATGSVDLSSRTESTAAELQQTASHMAQLGETVVRATQSAIEANTLASLAAGVAQKGAATVARVVTSMGEIDASSKRIADIIGVIDSIAFQTKILALNAAVEAAHAGEQGRGFAAVASEVRNLAQRSTGAAREIKSLIGASIGCVQHGLLSVAEAGDQMAEIVGSIRNVARIVSEISTGSQEQSQGLGVVNKTVIHVEQMTQQNAALVELSSAAAGSMRDQTGQLTLMLSQFRLSSVT